METKKKTYLLELPEAFMALLEQNAEDEGLTKAAYIRTVILRDMLSKNVGNTTDKRTLPRKVSLTA